MDHKGLDFNLKQVNCPGMGLIRSSLHGLILVDDFHQRYKGVLFVRNLLTGCCVSLPKCPFHESCGASRRLDPLTNMYELVPITYSCRAAFGFDPLKKLYKVVHICADGYGFETLTLGHSAWRRIPGPFDESSERPFDAETLKWSDPVSINGEIMHWYVVSDEYVVSMSVSDKNIYRTYFPDTGQKIEKDRYKLLEIGGYLAFVYKASSSRTDVWILEHCNEQSWEKRHSMVAESVHYPDSNLSSTTIPRDHNPFQIS